MGTDSIVRLAPMLPARLAHLADWSWHQVTLGRSDATVWRADKGDDRVFLKIAPIHLLSEMPGDIARLQWLATATTIKAPRVREAFDADGCHWLLMSALPGSDLSQLSDRPDDLILALASGLRALHDLDIATCPFDHALDAKLAAGAANVAAGLVDETDFDDAFDGWTATAVLDWLLAHRPAAEDLVVCHGDASLPNLMADGANLTGIIDCGRLGVADRWQDLAIACRSIIWNCGQEHVAPFLAIYGAAWDEDRYRYYCALDELF
ncbi:APH(3') family aminoglycoside O-phosphotransferase [Devosia sp. SL43]|uniref:APH(3') family aminoglycoside O-phosphotransferase n=1 Tax=Devosia sp. SL43 TaxID=2806348 RepID=UPI001F2D906C|nr:APH(3') family aminoglycoside O-phosphotransferase [Devosia sp. SL43]UJW86205.1 aminoglycoside 3'-phosphotransferase [Devosia sp. SL43]